MRKKIIEHIDSTVVLAKYINNEPPLRRELCHWLVDLPFLIEKSRGADDNLESFAHFYLDTAAPFIQKALRKKLGFKDAIYFVNYSVLNSIDDISTIKVSMENIINIEKKNYKEIIKYLNKMKLSH